METFCFAELTGENDPARRMARVEKRIMVIVIFIESLTILVCEISGKVAALSIGVSTYSETQAPNRGKLFLLYENALDEMLAGQRSSPQCKRLKAFGIRYRWNC